MLTDARNRLVEALAEIARLTNESDEALGNGAPLQSVGDIMNEHDQLRIERDAALAAAENYNRQHINKGKAVLNDEKCAIDKDVPWASSSAIANDSSAVTVMGLCETEQLFLHPNQTYRFRVCPGCQRCAEIARYADGPVDPVEAASGTQCASAAELEADCPPRRTP